MVTVIVAVPPERDGRIEREAGGCCRKEEDVVGGSRGIAESDMGRWSSEVVVRIGCSVAGLRVNSGVVVIPRWDGVSCVAAAAAAAVAIGTVGGNGKRGDENDVGQASGVRSSTGAHSNVIPRGPVGLKATSNRSGWW